MTAYKKPRASRIRRALVGLDMSMEGAVGVRKQVKSLSAQSALKMSKASSVRRVLLGHVISDRPDAVYEFGGYMPEHIRRCSMGGRAMAAEVVWACQDTAARP
jgi:hypothetical protein